MGKNENLITIEVVYALPERQCLLTLKMEKSSTIAMAIEASGILTAFPDLKLNSVGIFGKRKQLSDILQDGDRIEIYRPLTIDPKEARLAKVKQLKRKR